MSLISIHGAYLFSFFSDAPLLDNTELHIEENECVCLVGRNGAGKSTLMKIINGEQPLDDGRIIFEHDLVMARLQQDPLRNITGSVYDFVAEGVEEQAEHLKAYLRHFPCGDARSPARKTSTRWDACRRFSITTICGSWRGASTTCCSRSACSRIPSFRRCRAAGCTRRRWAAHW
nr:23S rRNA (guanine(2445)-N(2))/(guanine(2069)-N(7))-methyltransferase [Candidatus Pantoea persica]